MALKPNVPLLIAIDTNVALDLADGVDEVVESLNTIRNRIREGTLRVPPTVVLELGHAAEFGETPDKRCRQEIPATTPRVAFPAGSLRFHRTGGGRSCRAVLASTRPDTCIKHFGSKLAPAALFDCCES